MSKKNKIAVALLGALFSNNSASAMNTNKNINKNLSVQTSGFSISKNSKLDSQSPQTLGAVGGVAANNNFSNDKARGFSNWAKNHKPVLIAAGTAVAALVAVPVIGFTIFGSKKEDNGQKPGSPNDPEKNKNLLPIVEESKKLFFDNLSSEKQIFDALKKIAQNYKFFGLDSSDVGFGGEVHFVENADAVEFYKEQNKSFKTKEDIGKIQQDLNNLKNQLANIENAIGTKISSEDDIQKLNDEYVKLKKKFLEVPNVVNKINGFLSSNFNKRDEEFKFSNVHDYIGGKKLSFLLSQYSGFADWINYGNNEIKRLIEFEQRENEIKQILINIEKCSNGLKGSGMNENFVDTIERSKQFQKLFSLGDKIRDFTIVFNKSKNYGENKQNICFEFNFYDNSNKKLWCRYNMNFKDKKVEIAVGTQTQDISVQ